MLDRSRHGSQTDTLVIIVVLFAIAVAVVMSQTVVNEFQAANTVLDAQYMSAAEGALQIFDLGIVFIGASMFMASIILAFRIPTSPVFFIPSTILLLLATWVSAEFANVFQEIINVAAVTAAANEFPALITVFENFPLVMLGFGLLLQIAMFTRVGRTTSGQVAAQ